MSLIVETGTGNANAETYASLAFADAYAEGLGNQNGWSAQHAESSLLIANNFSDGDQLTIDAKVYTFQAVLTNVDGNILIGASPFASVLNLVNALSLTGAPGVDYALLMTSHPTVRADSPSGVAAATRFFARKEGVAGNAIVLVAVVASDNNFWDTPTLEGGTARISIKRKEQALRRATQYLDGRFGPRFRGTRSWLEQALEWPRVDVVDDSGFLLFASTIPLNLQKACVELALASLDPTAGGELAPTVDDAAPIVRNKVKAGPVEQDLAFGAGGNVPGERLFQRAELLLTQLIRPAGILRRA